MPLEEQSTSEVDSGEVDSLITNFETLSNTTEESCPIDGGGSPNSGYLERVSTEPGRGQARPQFQPEFQLADASARYRADSQKDEMLPLSSHWTLQQRLPRTSPEETSVPG